jgi:hypothetical protein
MPQVIRALKRFCGALCIVVGAFVCLFAAVGFFIEADRHNYAPVIAVASVGGVLLACGARLSWTTRSKPPVQSIQPQPRSTAVRDPRPTSKQSKRKYDDVAFGDPPPSPKQFGYAMSLGVEIKDGMTKWMMRDAIDEAIEHQRDGEPANQEQLREIQKMHGALPRAITRGEARRVIEFLEDHTLPCPFCGIPISAFDQSCCACNRSLRRMKIPIAID